jgi:hypothetical protein
MVPASGHGVTRWWPSKLPRLLMILVAGSALGGVPLGSAGQVARHHFCGLLPARYRSSNQTYFAGYGRLPVDRKTAITEQVRPCAPAGSVKLVEEKLITNTPIR